MDASECSDIFQDVFPIDYDSDHGGTAAGGTTSGPSGSSRSTDTHDASWEHPAPAARLERSMLIISSEGKSTLSNPRVFIDSLKRRVVELYDRYDMQSCKLARTLARLGNKMDDMSATQDDFIRQSIEVLNSIRSKTHGDHADGFPWCNMGCRHGTSPSRASRARDVRPFRLFVEARGCHRLTFLRSGAEGPVVVRMYSDDSMERMPPHPLALEVWCASLYSERDSAECCICRELNTSPVLTACEQKRPQWGEVQKSAYVLHQLHLSRYASLPQQRYDHQLPHVPCDAAVE